MRNDFDTPIAVAQLFELARTINRNRTNDQFNASVEDARLKLIELAEILGLDLSEPTTESLTDAAPFIDLLVELRAELRTAKQFALADSVRDRLADLGVTIEDTRQGTIWKSS
ncbi:MAG: hypothetical protein M9950_02865 [Thermomicrobiales bacterium]|nr:hypothetical protein [Thermomicrobiales bacterium]